MEDGRIACTNITKKYGEVDALRGVDLAVEPGDFLILLGPNGAGKTTLIKILCGLLQPDSGSASVGGINAHDTKARGKVGVISHQSFLYNSLTAKENLLFYAKLYGVKNPAKRADELLKNMELSTRANDLAGTFSRGMTQRLSIARALVADPDFVFLDEPFTGLDLHSADIFKVLLKKLHARGKTIVMITHDIETGISLSNRAAILRGGRKIYDASTGGINAEKLKNVYRDKVGA